VVSRVGPGIHVLDGSPRASRGRGCFWHGFCYFLAFARIHFSGQSDMRNVFDLCVKSWQYFHTYGISLNSVSNWLSYDTVRFKIEVGVDVKCTRM